MAKVKLTTKKKTITKEEMQEKQEQYEIKFADFTAKDYKHNIHDAKISFILFCMTKELSPVSIKDYERFFVKYAGFLNFVLSKSGNPSLSVNDVLKATPVKIMQSDLDLLSFKLYLKDTKNGFHKKPLGEQTVNHYLRSYRAFGNYCRDELGWIKTFACPINEVEPPAKETYTKKEIQALVSNKPSIEDFTAFRNYTIVLTLLSTAARVKSLVEANIGDVDIEGGYITYQKTKTHKVLRIGLESTAVIALQQYIDLYRREDIDGNPIPDTEPLFCNAQGERMSRHGFYYNVCQYAKARGVERTGLHLFRHTYAKEWITSGGDTITLKKVLGHSDMKMVNRYANLYDTDVKEEILVHSPLAQVKKKSGKSLNTKFKKGK